MNWRLYQRLFELTAILAMLAGIVLMWKGRDPNHHLVYIGFMLLATGKLIEAMQVNDPDFKILKMTICICMYLLVMLNLLFGIRSIVYILVPLGIYYALHYRWLFQQRKT